MTALTAITNVLTAHRAKRSSEREQLLDVVGTLVERDPGASVSVSELRQAVLFTLGRRHTDAELVEAVASCVMSAFVERKKKDATSPNRPRSIVGCRWAVRNHRAMLRRLSAKAVPSYVARAARYLRRNRWDEYPRAHRGVFEDWAVLGHSIGSIAHAHALTTEEVLSILTLHRARAGITRSETT